MILGILISDRSKMEMYNKANNQFISGFVGDFLSKVFLVYIPRCAHV